MSSIIKLIHRPSSKFISKITYSSCFSNFGGGAAFTYGSGAFGYGFLPKK
jgi:hypothetical protein